MALRGMVRAAVSDLPRAFWLLWVANLLNRAGAFVAIVLALYLSQQRGFDAGFVGLVIGVLGGAGALGGLVGGRLTDSWGRRSTLLMSYLGTAAALLAVAFSTERPAILLGAGLLGFFQSTGRPTFTTMMIDIVPDEQRAKAFSLNYWANNAAFTFAALVGGLVAAYDFTLVFVINAATTVATGLILFFLIGETRPVEEPGSHEAGPPERARPFRDPAFMALCLVTFLGSVVFVQHLNALPLAMSADGLSARTFGVIIAINSVLIVAGQLLVPSLVNGFPRSRVMATASVLIGVGFGLTALADSAWAYAATVVIWTVGEMMYSPIGGTLAAALSPTYGRGSYQGALSLCMALAALLGPVAAGFAAERAGSTWVWVGCLVAGLAAAAVALASGGRWERRTIELRPVAQSSTGTSP